MFEYMSFPQTFVFSIISKDLDHGLYPYIVVQWELPVVIDCICLVLLP